MTNTEKFNGQYWMSADLGFAKNMERHGFKPIGLKEHEGLQIILNGAKHYLDKANIVSFEMAAEGDRQTPEQKRRRVEAALTNLKDVAGKSVVAKNEAGWRIYEIAVSEVQTAAVSLRHTPEGNVTMAINAPGRIIRDAGETVPNLWAELYFSKDA